LRLPEDCWLQPGRHASNSTAIPILRSWTSLISSPREHIVECAEILQMVSADLSQEIAFYFAGREIRQRFLSAV
jgi:hypothetical protein